MTGPIVILRGNPTDAEIVALVLALAASAAAGNAPEPEPIEPGTAWRGSVAARYRKPPAAWGFGTRVHRRPVPAGVR